MFSPPVTSLILFRGAGGLGGGRGRESARAYFNRLEPFTKIYWRTKNLQNIASIVSLVVIAMPFMMLRFIINRLLMSQAEE